jgi:spoIIIJ-associated protein
MSYQSPINTTLIKGSEVQILKEKGIETAKQLMMGLLDHMGIKTEVEGSLKEGEIYLEVKGDKEGILIGKRGRTLDSLQFIINRMVNKHLKEPVKVYLDVNHYKERRADSLTKMAARLGERAKRTGKVLSIGPFNAHDRRTIHVALKKDPSLRTESFGEGEMKIIKIIPKSQTP